MANQDNFNLNSLKWVKQEIDTSLTLARENIQRYVGSGFQQRFLDESLQALGEALGTLEIAELDGGALLAREIHEVLLALQGGGVRDVGKPSRLAVRALVQLSDYLDYIELGNPDVPVVLVNIINELRITRRAELLSDDIVDIPGLKNDEALLSRQPHAQESMESLTGIARQVFELGLLGWYRNKDVEASLYKMAIVCRRLKNASDFSASRRLWWVSEAIICGLRSKVLPDSSALKLLIGKIDRQIKQLEAVGENRFSASVPQSLVRSLLYYVAMAHPGNKALDQVRDTYFLKEGDATQHALSAAQISIGGKNSELYRSLSGALQEKLTEIKDLMEIYIHAEPRSVEHLEPVLPLLKDLSGTMNMLGMKHQESFIKEYLERLQGVDLPDDALMADVAEMLVGVESAVQAFSMLGPTLMNASESSRQPGDAKQVQGMVDDEEFRHIRATVIQESKQNLERCKEAIQKYAANPNILSSLDPVPGILGQISGAMLLVSQESIAELLDAIGGFVQQRKEATKIISHEELEHVAEAISAIDVYLEILDTSGIEHYQYLSTGMAAVALLDDKADVADADPTGLFAQPDSGADASGLFNPETLVVDFNTMDEAAAEKPKKSFDVAIVRDTQREEKQESAKDEDLDRLVYGDEAFEDVAEEAGSESMLLEAATLTIAGFAGDEQQDILDLDDEISALDQDDDALPQFDVEDAEAVDLPADDPFAGTAFMSGELDAVVSELEAEPTDEALVGAVSENAGAVPEAAAEVVEVEDTLAGLDASLLEGAVEESGVESSEAERDEDATQIQIGPVSMELELPGSDQADDARADDDAEQAATEMVDFSKLEIPADDTLSALEIDAVSEPEESGATIIVEGMSTAAVDAEETASSVDDIAADGLSISGIEVEELSDEGQTGEIEAFPVIETAAEDESRLEEAPDTLAAMEIDDGLGDEPTQIGGIISEIGLEPVQELVAEPGNESEVSVEVPMVQDEDVKTAVVAQAELEGLDSLETDEPVADVEIESIQASVATPVTEEESPSEEIQPIQDFPGESEALPEQTGVRKIDLENLWDEGAEAPVESIVEDDGVLTLVDILPDDEVFDFSVDDESAVSEPADEETSKAAVAHEALELPPAASVEMPDVFSGLSVMKPGADEEIFDIFLEEFAEESAVLSSHFPKWREQPDNRDVLLTMRRSFHTLKGSARLVGAEIAGEYAWLHENILNQVLESSREVTPEIVSCIGEGVDLLPALLEQLKTKAAPEQALLSHAERAGALAQGESLPPQDEPVEAVDQVESPDTLISAAEDPVLMRIFIDEAKTHLQTLNSVLERLQEGEDAAAIKETLFRSIHTLNGSARTAKVADVYEPSAAFEHFLGLKFQHSSPLSVSDIELLATFSDHVADTLVALQEGGVAPDAAGLVDAAKALSKGLAEVVEKPEVGYTQVIDEEAVVDAAENAGATIPAEPVAAEEAGLPEISGELIEVFLGECEEILEHCDASMQRWKQDHEDMGVVRELYRELHTLKGSARMAGLQPVGDLSHAIENLLTEVEKGNVSVDKTLFTVVYGAFDHFGEMSEAIRAGKEVEPAAAIIDLMARLQEGQSLSESDLAVLRFAEPTDEAVPPAVQETTTDHEGKQGIAEFESHLADLTPYSEGQGASGQLLVSRLQDSVKVNPDLLDQFVDSVGEINILHSRVEQQMSGFGFNLHELERTVSRLTEQLRRLEMEAEAQILHRFDGKNIDPDQTGINEQFDPLELDRYSTIQQLSRSLAESTNDLLSIHQLLSDGRRDMENLLQQESRVSNSLQESLMRTRMSPFKVMAPRLRRVVRGVALELGKEVDLEIEGEEQELDRKVLEGIVVPLEHLLRNALAHGIESPVEREACGKPAAGQVTVKVSRQGPEVIIEVSDDGAGIDKRAVRQRGVEMGIIEADATLTDAEIYALVLHPGFSTATEISQVSGRGVGMDVVQEQLKHLNGLLEISSEEGVGTQFKISLPFTMAINQSLLVRVGDNTYAIPINTVEGVIQMPGKILQEKLQGDSPAIEYANRSYQLFRLDEVLENRRLEPLARGGDTLPVLLAGVGEHSIALVVDDIKGNQDVVVKPIGGLLNSVLGLGGATILGDGQVVLILDTAGVVRAATGDRKAADTGSRQEVVATEKRPTIMVVDDSITIRRVTEKMLERHHFNVVTAKDGLDAVARLEEVHPDMMLLDIEMPRMDGFELAAHMRSSELNQDIPIIMISSRTGKKHRERAEGLGIKEFLGKPYQDAELLANIELLLNKEKVGAQHVS